MSEQKLTAEEVELHPGEMLFTRTDERGMIRCANESMLRMCGYVSDQLLGARQRLLQHPETPEGVYRLIWERIPQGLPTAVYLKNKTEDGKGFWVMSLVSPVDGGYFTMSIKPTAPLFDQIRDVYTMIAQEKDADADKSKELLLRAIEDLGYRDYDDLMSDLLHQELKGRVAAGHGKQHSFLKAYDDLKETLSTLNTEQATLVELFESLNMLPTNMRIVASRLESAGGPVSAVSESYRLSVGEVSGQLRDLRNAEGGGVGLSRLMHQALVEVACLVLQQECVESYSRGDEIDGIDHRKERQLLDNATGDRDDKANATLREVIQNANRLAQSCSTLRTQMVGLDQIRIMGDIESGRRAGDNQLKVLMDQLRSYHDDIGQRLMDLIYTANDLQNRTLRSVA